MDLDHKLFQMSTCHALCWCCSTYARYSRFSAKTFNTSDESLITQLSKHEDIGFPWCSFLFYVIIQEYNQSLDPDQAWPYVRPGLGPNGWKNIVRAQKLPLVQKVFFVWYDLILYVPVNMFSHLSGQVFLGWTSAKQRIKCLAQGHNIVPLLRLKPANPRSPIKHSTTEPPRSS